MSLFDDLAKDSEEYLKNWEAGNNGENNEVMQQIADLEKKMTEKLEEATKNYDCIISEELAIFNNIKVGDSVEFGGLLGAAPVMPINTASPEKFINRGGRIPAPIHSLRN